MTLVVSALPMDSEPVEIVERKGIGHPEFDMRRPRRDTVQKPVPALPRPLWRDPSSQCRQGAAVRRQCRAALRRRRARSAGRDLPFRPSDRDCGRDIDPFERDRNRRIAGLAARAPARLRCRQPRSIAQPPATGLARSGRAVPALVRARAGIGAGQRYVFRRRLCADDRVGASRSQDREAPERPPAGIEPSCLGRGYQGDGRPPRRRSFLDDRLRDDRSAPFQSR